MFPHAFLLTLITLNRHSDFSPQLVFLVFFLNVAYISFIDSPAKDFFEGLSFLPRRVEVAVQHLTKRMVFIIMIVTIKQISKRVSSC